MKDEKMIALYQESANAIRHYSNCIKNMRTTALVQGLVICTVVGYTLRLTESIFFWIVVIFGLLFTLILLWQQANYLKDFSDHMETAECIENHFEIGGDLLPWSKYAQRHRKVRSGKEINGLFFKLRIEYGPFTVFIFIYLLLIMLKSMDLLPIIEEIAKKP